MKIKAKMWKKYIEKMAEIDKKAAKRMEDWIDKHGVEDREALIDYANSLILHYGESSGSLACRMYDAIAKAQNVKVLPSEIAKMPKYGEVAKAINGALKQSENMIPSAVARMTKQIGADTMLYNAERDHAQFKWISSGDSCKFCNMLASRDWQYVSKDTLKNGHAEHIHANCKCQYAIRFDETTVIQQKEDVNVINESGVVDVTDEYINNATPGVGKIVFDNGTTKDSLRDRETATWINKKFGGDIICLPEVSEIGKNPDSLWNNYYWEFKQPTTANAIDDRIKKAKRQIVAAQERNNILGEKSGIVIDLSKSKIPIDEAVEVVERKSKERLKNTDVIIRYNDDVVKVIRIK